MPFLIFALFRFRENFREYRLIIFILAQVFAKITGFSVSSKMLLKYIHVFGKQLIFLGCFAHFLPSYTYFLCKLSRKKYFRKNIAKNFFAKIWQNVIKIFSQNGHYVAQVAGSFFSFYCSVKVNICYFSQTFSYFSYSFSRNIAKLRKLFSWMLSRKCKHENFRSNPSKYLNFGIKESRMGHIGTRVQWTLGSRVKATGYQFHSQPHQKSDIVVSYS